MENIMHSNKWSYEEFDAIELGDQRINERLKKVGQLFYEKPQSSINESCAGWKDTKAAYRLFDNNKFDISKILEVHREKTLHRIFGHKTILAIQDTTFFNYDNHESKSGLGLIHSNHVPVHGCLAHNTLITNLDGLPLGLFE